MISVIVCTNRQEFVNSIILNFQKQTLEEKELILIVNSTSMHVVGGKSDKLLQLSEEISLGECLNRGVSLAKYEYIAKMDDDDYYGPNYLMEAYQTLKQTDADVVGKSSFYIYFKKNQELRLYNLNRENRWIINNRPYQTSYFFSGATLVWKKHIFTTVQFPDVNLGEDSGFQRLCYEKGMKMYALSKEHYAYLRYPDPMHHHSDAMEQQLRRRSKFITNVVSIESYLDQ
ncbi:glycosyltransferase family 2 protein [Neobacillus sp. NPDC058068]|uniref:glycosyltransferase family 2 protein n=1 Tax=Neobacillus sp. NPDC058068 TaxID=3346325 RepID=UPI0036DDD6D9